MAALTNRSVAAVLSEYGGKGFGSFKPALAEVMVAAIAPITARFNDLRYDSTTLDAVLADGAARARAIAEPVLAEVHRAVGFIG
jgi:tryptophanyl-tRNA synthetase